MSATPWFQGEWSPCAVLDPDLRLRAVNKAYAQVTGHPLEALEGGLLFELFPANPADLATTSGVNALARSLEQVLSRGRREWLGVHRYDLPDPSSPGLFVPKIWTEVNAPIRRDGRVVGIVNHVQDVTNTVGATARTDAHPAVGRALEGCAQALVRQFPDLTTHLVLSTLTHSHRLVLGALGHPSPTHAADLARLRLEINTGRPARGSEA